MNKKPVKVSHFSPLIFLSKTTTLLSKTTISGQDSSRLGSVFNPHFYDFSLRRATFLHFHLMYDTTISVSTGQR